MASNGEGDRKGPKNGASEKGQPSSGKGNAPSGKDQPSGTKPGQGDTSSAAGGSAPRGAPPIMKRSGPPPTIEGKAREVKGADDKPATTASSDKTTAPTTAAASAPASGPAKSAGVGSATGAAGATGATGATGSAGAASAASSKTATGAASTPAAKTSAGTSSSPESSSLKSSSAKSSSPTSSPSKTGTTATAPASSAKAPPPRTTSSSGGSSGSGRGFGSLLTAALLGGVVGAGFIWLVSGLTGGDDDLVAQMETLQARIGSLETSEPKAPDHTAVDTRVVALEERLAALPAAPEAGESVASLEAAVAALQTELATQADRIDAANTATTPAGDGEAVAALQTQLAETQARIDALQAATGTTPEPSPEIVERLAALETQVAGMPGQSGVEAATADLATSDQFTGIETRLDEMTSAIEAAQNDELASRVDTLATTTEQARAEISGRLDALSADLTAMSDASAETSATLEATDESLRNSVEEVRNQLAALDVDMSAATDRLDEVAAAVNAPGDRERAFAAVALAGLQGAVDRGAPYATYLDSLSASGLVPAEADAALRERADAALPTWAQLVTRWDAAAREARRAAVRSEASSGVAGIFASARSLVDVAPVDPGDGDDVNALVSRIGERLDDGAFDEAVALWDRLPTAAQDATRAWGENAKARLTVESAIRDASDAVMSGQLAPEAGTDG